MRRELASALQRVPEELAWRLASALVEFGDDAEDHNLPTLLWYGISPLAGSDPERALELAVDSAHARTSVALERPSLAHNPMIQHELAEAWMALEGVRSQLEWLSADWVSGFSLTGYRNPRV